MLCSMKARSLIAKHVTGSTGFLRVIPTFAVFGLLTANSALAGFKGHFAPGNWKLTTNEASATLDLTLAPRQVTFVSSGPAGNEAAWTVQVPIDGEISFDWQYAPGTVSPVREDSAGFTTEGGTVELTSPSVDADSGRASVAVKAGQPFTIWIRTAGKTHAPGRLTLRNFTYNGLPRINRLNLGNSNVGVAFDSVPGRTHRVQACNDLNTCQWVDVSPDILAADAETFYSMARKAGDMMFYRILLLPDSE